MLTQRDAYLAAGSLPYIVFKIEGEVEPGVACVIHYPRGHFRRTPHQQGRLVVAIRYLRS